MPRTTTAPVDESPDEPTAEAIPPGHKICESCTEVRSLSTFARSSSSDDGRAAVCRICRSS